MSKIVYAIKTTELSYSGLRVLNVKIGQTSDVTSTLRQYRRSNPEVEVLDLWELNASIGNPFECERGVHKLAEKYAYSRKGETFVFLQESYQDFAENTNLLLKNITDRIGRGKKKKKPARRYALRKKFWQQLLSKAKRKTNLHSNVSPGIYSWVGAGAGKSGLSYNYTITGKYSSCELYIDRGKGYLELNKKRFDQLYAHKEEIEKIFGDNLEWERLGNKRASRIVKRFKGVGLYDDQEKWNKLQDKMIDCMIRLEGALRNYIKEL